MSLRRLARVTILSTAALLVPARAQGPMQKRINFTINVPFELKTANVVLPPGNYVLYQIEPHNPSMFALYRDDLTHSPLAIVSTVRIDYRPGRYPGKTRLLMDTNEASPAANAVLDGWNIPGEDGWEMIAAVSHREGLTAKYHAR